MKKLWIVLFLVGVACERELESSSEIGSWPKSRCVRLPSVIRSTLATATSS